MDDGHNGHEAPVPLPTITVVFSVDGTPALSLAHGVDATKLAAAAKWLDVLAGLQMGHVLAQQSQEQTVRIARPTLVRP